MTHAQLLHRTLAGAWCRAAALLSAALAVVLVLAGGMAAPLRAQEPYRVGAGDMLSISIYGQPEISGVHEVRADGSVVLHLLGPVHVAGDTLGGIEAAIVTRASEVLQNVPSVVVDISEYRKVYIVGAVDRPGAFAYFPGMTVMMAVATAGGLQRVSIDDISQLSRMLDERQQVLLSRSRIASMEARSSSLEHEIERLDSGGTAPSSSDPLMRARMLVLQTQLDGIEQRRALAQEEVDTLSKNQAMLEGQLAQEQSDLNDGQKRAGGGYVNADRLSAMRTEVDRLRENVLDVLATGARARRDLSEAVNDATMARMRYLQDLQSEKLDTDDKLSLERINLQSSLEMVAQYGAADQVADAAVPMTQRYTVQRRTDSGVTSISVDPTSPLNPDDVLTVEQVLPVN